MNALVSALAPQFARFLAHKRSLGYAYSREEAFVHELDRFAMRSHDTVLSETLARTYLATFSKPSRPARLTLVRQLGRFVAFEEPRTFVPPRRFLGIRRERPVIRVLLRDEARRFLEACDRMPGTASFSRRVVHATGLKTLLLTGLRRGELLALKDEDVDLTQGVLTIHRGKFGKSRFVTLAPDVVACLQAYRSTLTSHMGPRRPRDAFFPRADGRRPTAPKSLYKSFRQALSIAGIEHHGRGQGPRLHDLRHAFAVLRLLTWYEAGGDLGVKLPLLATYLGHVGLTTSQVYLHMTRDLVGEVTKRQLNRFKDLITEVAT